MLNASCQIEQPLNIIALHWITSFISIPVYIVAFLILLFKCPKYFNEYRNHLVTHIISGLLQDFHIRMIWKLSVPLPWTALCSSGFLYEYSVISFQLFILLLVCTGISILSILIYRMEAATKHIENLKFQKTVYFLRRLYYASSGVLLVFLILVYPDLKNQKEYKMEMEQKRGKFPEYIWCDNCFFMQFDSRIFLYFYCQGYFTVLCAFLCGILAFVETLRALYSNNVRLSPKTTAIQKNFMFSLIAAISVHIVLIYVPLIFYFVANFTTIENQYITPILVILFQDHGSVSTFTMIITNNLLRRATKKLFLIPENLIRRSEPRIFERKRKKKTSGIQVLTSN